MTKRGKQGDDIRDWEEHLSAKGLSPCSEPYKGDGLDPRIVELVRFMARRAAESDHEAMLKAAKTKEQLFPEGQFEK